MTTKITLSHERTRPSLARLGALGLLCLASACSGGSGSSRSSSTDLAHLDLFVTDAPADELLSFNLTLEQVHLLDAGGPGPNLLAGPVSVELLGLAGTQRWLVRDDAFAAGSHTGLRLSFDPDSVVARDRSGAVVAVSVLSDTLEILFDSPHHSAAGEDLQWLVDFDLSSSLSGALAAPPLVFDPVGSVSFQDDSASTGIDEVHGVVQSIRASSQSFVLQAFADADMLVPLGAVSVDVGPTTLLLDDDGFELGSRELFFQALSAGSTSLEVHGSLSAGRISATRIEIEDQQGGLGGEDRVRIEGLVTNLDPGAQSFDLLMIELEKGAELAQPVLDGLGNPTSIPVQWDASTLFLTSEHSLVSAAELSEGARVKAKFASFATTPFAAARIELEGGPEFEGRIVDVAGLPDRFVMHLDHDEPALASGQVDSSSTPVTVELTGATIFLGTHDRPALLAQQLLVGLKVEAQHANLEGPSSAPTVTQQRLKVFAGRFSGSVTGVAPSLSSFDAGMDDLKDSFGETVDFGGVAVHLHPDCRFERDADSESSFFALFAGLQPGETLEIEVFGIGSGEANEVLAYELEARVR